MQIKKIAIFPGTRIGSWVFRISISNEENIMIMAFSAVEPTDMIIRFFSALDAAQAFVAECAEGKHSP